MKEKKHTMGLGGIAPLSPLSSRAAALAALLLLLLVVVVVWQGTVVAVGLVVIVIGGRGSCWWWSSSVGMWHWTGDISHSHIVTCSMGYLDYKCVQLL
jgi:hypothetical protein